MCVVSAVTDYYTRQWPERFPDRPIQTFPPEVLKELKEILDRLDKIDKRLGDIECKDEAKDAFFKTVGGVE